MRSLLLASLLAVVTGALNIHGLQSAHTHGSTCSQFVYASPNPAEAAGDPVPETDFVPFVYPVPGKTYNFEGCAPYAHILCFYPEANRAP